MILHLISLLLIPSAHSETWDKILNSYPINTKTTNISCAKEEGLCGEHPYQEICNEIKNSKTDQIKNELRKKIASTNAGDAFELQYKKIMDRFNDLGIETSEEGKLNAASDLFDEAHTQIKLVATLEGSAYKKFSQNSINLNKLYESIRSSLMNHIQNSSSFDRKSDSTEINPSAQDIINKLKSVKLETAQSISEESKPTTKLEIAASISKLSMFFQTCGQDGLEINAFYDPLSNTLKICPGFLIQTLSESGGNLEAFTSVLGHELGHSIDAVNTIPIEHQTEFQHQFKDSKVITDNEYCYNNFLNCIQKNYIDDNIDHFGTLKGMIDQLKLKGLPNLYIELKKLEESKNLDINDIALVKSNILTGESLLSNYEFQYSELIKQFKNPNNIKEVQKRELTADYHGTIALLEQIKSLAPKNRGTFIKSNLKFFCGTAAGNRIRKIKYDGVNDAVHPPNSFRVEMALRNPEIRSLLNCKPLVTPRPWCDTK